tara:strand:+ start:105 stop:608 length:504 start_codon:yes stop_codon:yes gene_type:complete
MSLLNPPKPLTATLSSKGVPAFSAVNTMMGITLNQDIIDKMIEAVTRRALEDLGHTIAHNPLDTDPDTNMLAIDREFKYGKGKEIIAFADGGRGVGGKDLKYVKFFYWYDTSKASIKGGEGKTYSYSVEKARNFWNDKVAEGYTRFDIVSEEPEKSPTDLTPVETTS